MNSGAVTGVVYEKRGGGVCRLTCSKIQHGGEIPVRQGLHGGGPRDSCHRRLRRRLHGGAIEGVLELRAGMRALVLTDCQDSLLAKYRPDLLHLPTTNGDHTTGARPRLCRATWDAIPSFGGRATRAT